MKPKSLTLRSGLFGYIEANLQDYHNIKREIALIRGNVIHSSGQAPEIRGTDTSDPTARKAVTLCVDRRLEWMERFVQVVEEVYEQLDDTKREFMRLRYWSKPRRLTIEGIAYEIHVDRRTITRWRQAIIIEIAERLGLC